MNSITVEASARSADQSPEVEKLQQKIEAERITSQNETVGARFHRIGLLNALNECMPIFSSQMPLAHKIRFIERRHVQTVVSERAYADMMYKESLRGQKAGFEAALEILEGGE